MGSLPVHILFIFTVLFTVNNGLFEYEDNYFGGIERQKYAEKYAKYMELEQIMYWTYPCDKSPAMKLDFCNQSLSIDERVNNLLDELTMNETISETANWAGPVPRLNITCDG